MFDDNQRISVSEKDPAIFDVDFYDKQLEKQIC